VIVLFLAFGLSVLSAVAVSVWIQRDMAKEADQRLRAEVGDDCYNFIKNMRRYRRTGKAPWE
jgi:hypothetical protein